jgi:universal stress protein E
VGPVERDYLIDLRQYGRAETQAFYDTNGRPMKKIERILVIADKAKHRQTAMKRAIELGKRTGAHLHMVGFTYSGVVEQRDVFETHQRRAMKKELLRQRADDLRAVVREEGASALDLDIEPVWEKNIHDWVVDRAGRERYDLVIKSVHRTRTLIHTPTDWHLLRECATPVLLAVHARWPKRPRILATVDLTRTDRAHTRLNDKVLDAAATFAKVMRAELHACFAIEVSEVVKDLDLFDLRKYSNRMAELAQPRIDAIRERYDIPKSRFHTPTGKTGAAVNAVADRIKAELLVLGTTARRGVEGFVLGNTAERVLAKAHTDILAVKP